MDVRPDRDEAVGLPGAAQGINNEWATMHCGTSPGGQCNEKSGIGGQRACTGTTCQGGFHVYAVEWDRSTSPEQMRFYLDGVNFHTVRANQMDAGTWAAATNHGFFIILNVAMGGEFPCAFGCGPDGGTAGGHPMVVDYVTVMMLGQVTAGQWSYLKPDGTMAHINHLDASAPGHLTKNGVNYANMAFTLAQAPTVTLPPYILGGRIYISLGSPMYIPVSPDDAGWGGPDLHNPADPNADVYFDWYEYTFGAGSIAFGGNTTQVDMFGFPMTARLRQTAIGYDQTVGITATRAAVFAQYATAVGPAFRPLAGTFRITAPRSAAAFAPSGGQANYLQSYIDQVWNQYTAGQFTLTRLNQTFTGRVTGGVLQFTKDGAGPFQLAKPSTKDVMECSGALASAGMSTTALQLGAEFCAAFNRGVAQNTADWYNSSIYYKSAAKNDYAQFFHTISLANRAYGFAYDDINDQSSVRILPNSNPPTSLTLGIGW